MRANREPHRALTYDAEYVAETIARFPALTRYAETEPDSHVATRLADIEEALERMPEDMVDVLRLRGLQRMRNADAALTLGVHRNTTSRRYMRGLRWAVEYLNKRPPMERIRELKWRDWVHATVAVPPPLELRKAKARRGRSPSISADVDLRVLELHCSGTTERDIATALNAEFRRTDGRRWTRDSVRSVLRRYEAPVRPPGPRPTSGRYNLGDVTRSDYGEIEFDIPLCTPEELLERRATGANGI
jgi:predicted DNA-binding protein (UPF0251 family)